MSYLFATSHLPEAERPEQHEAEDETARTQPRSGGVRAFSHLPAAPRRHRPAGMEKIQIDDGDPRFVKLVRAALSAEAAESPTAAALLAHVSRLPGTITVKQQEHGMSQTVTDEGGHVTIHLNPGALTGATLSHELAHVVQQVHTHHALQHHQRQRRQITRADLEDAIMAGLDALHQIAPVKDERDPGPEHKENEAMRISNKNGHATKLPKIFNPNFSTRWTPPNNAA